MENALSDLQQKLFGEVADLHGTPSGAYNLRADGKVLSRSSTANIDIKTNSQNNGIEIHIKDNTKNESIHIPVILTQTGHMEVVHNDFYIGENCDVLIVAGCGIDNCGDQKTEHDGIHTFHVAKNSKVRYVEKHFGSGEGTGEKILNPVTEVFQDENSVMEMEMVQIRGVDSTDRRTIANLKANAKFVVKERLLTHDRQKALSVYKISLDGDGSSADVVSRSIAKDYSYQKLDACISGNARCNGHTECDSIIMDHGTILAVPSLEANHVDAALIHEAAIGKIAGEQLIKLMILGLDEHEAEDQIISGFLG